MKVLVFPVLLGLAVYASHLEPPKPTHWVGTISNGMKGDKISFDVSPDGKTVSNLLFQGYWRCAGKLEQTSTGPAGSFPVRGGKASGVVVDPPAGGASAWRYEFEAAVGKATAQGSFRMNINGLGCDTYKLQWTAAPADKGGQ
ncbi:hypothetical protein LJ737_01570 [Hymenobacter sp. 15J16-1T3B]|uniref:hypothetical protein n=1 Tax=Hymenobacter sp. 15J16-1T3B TaxID=2886941 RepID=UPI001D1139A7|nr:hypothetical protein [Hymenobacter sp. 15J16-1T3B]MCC3155907.1 hypothetical protein [Hymenobacter sp. 15J16-1T3B]